MWFEPEWKETWPCPCFFFYRSASATYIQRLPEGSFCELFIRLTFVACPSSLHSKLPVHACFRIINSINLLDHPCPTPGPRSTARLEAKQCFGVGHLENGDLHSGQPFARERTTSLIGWNPKQNGSLHSGLVFAIERSALIDWNWWPFWRRFGLFLPHVPKAWCFRVNPEAYPKHKLATTKNTSWGQLWGIPWTRCWLS